MRRALRRNLPVLALLLLAIVAIRYFEEHRLTLRVSQHQSIAYGLALFGGGLTLFGLLQLLWQAGRDRGAIRTTGTVVEYELVGSRPHPVIRFETAAGRTVTFRSPGGADPLSCPVGTRVPVTYAPEEPEQALVYRPGASWIVPATALVLGLGLLSGLVVALFGL
ncbi:MAG TPA: DUF3592 domain-containing protein [Candidatus Dormibacteraeota bacterium]|jgi:hypothetical protein|nr:DUF3592 domain-containing protein [Candidatus Dormibacteraeota bacterium]